MKFGYFDDNAKEYVITSPKTPLPWINYLGCEDFFSLVSNTCGGYSFYKDAKLLRLTRYRYNNVPGDSRQGHKAQAGNIVSENGNRKAGIPVSFALVPRHSVIFR